MLVSSYPDSNTYKTTGPPPTLVGLSTAKVYSGVGADIVMESFAQRFAIVSPDSRAGMGNRSRVLYHYGERETVQKVIVNSPSPEADRNTQRRLYIVGVI